MAMLRMIFLAMLLITTSVAYSQTTFTATLSGANEVPPTGSTGWGLGKFILSADQDSLYYALFWRIPNTYTASHIHAGPAGVNGGVVHALLNANSTGAHGAWAIDAANLSRLFNDSLYVNVHSNIFAGGEIRSQIRPVAFDDTTYTAVMSGANEVPPNASTGWGLGTFFLSDDHDSLYYALHWILNNTYTASHIHAGPAGVNGGVVHAFSNAGAVGAHGVWAIDALNLSRLGHDSLYANAHSNIFGGGEVRGQIYVSLPPAPTGRCCYTGTCYEGFTQDGCDTLGGDWGGDGTTCASDPCPPPPTGRCCYAGTCYEGYTQGACDTLGGDWGGDGTTCASDPCPPPPVTDLVIMPQPADSGLHLFWSPSAGASQYNVYLSTSLELLFDAGNFFISVADTHYLHTGAISEPAVRRYYGVTAE